ncbi:MAG: MCP four helix bundle domain-containing protein, partial [Chloroflexi bacterium]|nr:MCP four helix bundle domain-containing protein [Chloroflexota bacterium]
MDRDTSNIFLTGTNRVDVELEDPILMTMPPKPRLSMTEDPRAPRRRRLLTIGPRLLVSFLAIILLTALIGLLAVQQLSALTATTNELNTHDLPEVNTIGSLRTLLYRQRDLEQSLVTAKDQNTASNLTALTTTLDEI